MVGSIIFVPFTTRALLQPFCYVKSKSVDKFLLIWLCLIPHFDATDLRHTHKLAKTHSDITQRIPLCGKCSHAHVHQSQPAPAASTCKPNSISDGFICLSVSDADPLLSRVGSLLIRVGSLLELHLFRQRTTSADAAVQTTAHPNWAISETAWLPWRPETPAATTQPTRVQTVPTVTHSAASSLFSKLNSNRCVVASPQAATHSNTLEPSISTDSTCATLFVSTVTAHCVLACLSCWHQNRHVSYCIFCTAARRTVERRVDCRQHRRQPNQRRPKPHPHLHCRRSCH